MNACDLQGRSWIRAFCRKAVGKTVLEVASRFPSTRPMFSDLGRRTTDALFGKRRVQIALPPGSPRRTLTLTNLDLNYLSFQLFWRGIRFHEPITAMILQDLAEPGTNFIDVGANVGFFSLLIGCTRPGVTVHAFEPNPKNFRILKENVAVNGLDSFVCEPQAVSNRNGVSKLYLNESDMSASLVSTFRTGAEAREEWVEVRTVTLDSYFREHPLRGRVVVKVDVEGHEEALLEGAQEFIKEHKPDMVLEVLSQFPTRQTAFLRKEGYRFYPITNQGFVEAEDLRPVPPNPYVFFNYLASVQPKENIRGLFGRVQEEVQRMDLRETSKFLPGK